MLLAVVSSFILAELGDKTMLATVALASNHNWAGVWIGATAGMVLADGAAIAVGALLHKRLPEHFLHDLASVLFLIFGLWLLFEGALGLRWVAVGLTAAVALAAATAAAVAFVRRPSRGLAGVADARIVTGSGWVPGWLLSVERLTRLPQSTSLSGVTCRGGDRRDANRTRLPTQLANTRFR